MDDSRASKHIIVADFSIVSDVFIAVAYHTDLMIFRMMYDNETEMITSMMGPYGRVIETFTIDDPRVIEYFGTNISESLSKYIECRGQQCTTGS